MNLGNALLIVAAAGLALGLLAAFLYWLLVSTEGVFLGRRVVVWLYDVTAHNYDRLKQYDPRDEKLLVTRPILSAVRGLPGPLILDVATGTGRVPHDLLQAAEFRGRIIGVDNSRKMLDVARQKLKDHGGRLHLLQHPAVPLPFADNLFDVVTCLEALEFFPSDRAALQEMVRVLKPGRCLLATRRRGWEGKLFLHRHRSQDEMRAMLHSLGLEEIVFHTWEMNYDLVTAWNPPG